jgi:tetratricopeptide (TPR) repeat protein
MKQSHRLLPQKENKRIGRFLFNHVWDLMEKKKRTREDDAEMIRDVHAMRFHWGESGTPRNFAVSEWQIARVYSLLGMPESAIYHANKSLAYVKAGGEGFEDFHLPSAYEGLARAYTAAGEQRNARKYLALAKRLAARIKDPEDKKTILEQIASVPLHEEAKRTEPRT